jgi:hypothetical protein
MPLHLRVGDKFIGPGTVSEVRLGSDEPVRVRVFCGLATGPRLFIVSGLRGDEKLSVAIAKDLGDNVDPRTLHGVVFLIPQAAADAFRKKTRHVPGGGDLNRSFPGAAGGDPAQQIAHHLYREIVTRSDFGLVLHAAPEGRVTTPHLRGNLENPYVRRMCEAFGAALILDGPGTPRSIRRVATDFGVPTISYEAGGTARSEKAAVQEGLRGVLGVMANLRMIGGEVPWRGSPTIVRDARWLTSPRAGRLDVLVQPGATTRSGDVLARVEGSDAIVAPAAVVVLTTSAARSVQAGDSVVQVATPLDVNNASRNASAV